MLDQLEAFRPLPAREVNREIKHTFWTNRVRVALNLGALVADGFIIVEARDRDRIEPLGRELLRRARALGVGQALLPRAQSFIEHGTRGEWTGLKAELTGAQAEVESALTALHDGDMALLVGLGGWLRGLQCTSAATVEHYTPERARLLADAPVIDYYAAKLDGIDPALREPLVMKITAQVHLLAGILDKPAGGVVSEAEARQVYKICSALNAVIAAPDDG